MNKKYATTFKWFNGKRYGVRKGSNLHLALEFGATLMAGGVVLILGFVFAMLAV